MTTKKVRYIGDVSPVDLPSLGVVVEKGDAIDVGDDFVNANFEDVVETKKSKATPDPVTTKEAE